MKANIYSLYNFQTEELEYFLRFKLNKREREVNSKCGPQGQFPLESLINQIESHLGRNLNNKELQMSQSHPEEIIINQNQVLKMVGKKNWKQIKFHPKCQSR